MINKMDYFYNVHLTCLMGIFYQLLQGRIVSLQIETRFFLLKYLKEKAKNVNYNKLIILT